MTSPPPKPVCGGNPSLHSDSAAHGCNSPQSPCKVQPDPAACSEPVLLDASSKPSHQHSAQAPRLTFRRWSLSFAFRIIKTRTPFAAHLASVLHLTQATSSLPAKSLCPMPLPFFGIFRSIDPQMCSRSRLRIGIRRVVVVTVLALNYLRSGGCFPPLASLRRPPNLAQAKAFDYLERLVRACGASDGIDVPAASRRSSELIARLTEVSSHLTEVGSSFDAYGPAFPGIDLDASALHDALHPFRSLDASRLVLTGSGLWDAARHMDDSLYLAYVEPDSLLRPRARPPLPSEVPALGRDPPLEVLQLALLWDTKGLLRLFPSGPSADRPHEGVKVFNSLKNASTDRMIADRRGRNYYEAAIAGPSKHLPCGPVLTSLYVNPAYSRLSLNLTDRKDFYHQMGVTMQRARRNILVPALPAFELAKTAAFAALTSPPDRGTRREQVGDHLGASLAASSGATRSKAVLPEYLFAGFGAVMQGDSLGVEFACSAHANLLSSGGLLQDDSRILGSLPFLLGGEDGLCEGLVIDDYYAISSVYAPIGSRASPNTSAATKCLLRAKEVYKAEGLLGSEEKDVVDAACCTVAGAELDTSSTTRALGLALAGPPRAKRIALAAITLEACRLPSTSDHLHLCIVGGWVSACMYRRPYMAILNLAFHLVDASSVRQGSSRVLGLPRRVADELVLMAALCHIIVADLAAPWSDVLFATDASDKKGAIVASGFSADETERLWTSSSKLSESAKLLSREAAAFRRVDPLREEKLESGPSLPLHGPRKSPALRFHFLEVCGGTGKIGACLARKGWTVGPLLDLSASPQYDWTSRRLFSWLCHLVESGLVDAIFISPPCTTYSAAAFPPLRSYRLPYGFDPRHPRTRLGNILALRSLALTHTCHRYGIPCALEQPRTSKMASLPPWKAVAALPLAAEVFTVGCAFGMAHMKPWRFLTVAFDASRVARRCTRDHQHVRVQGKYTKDSAVYPDALASELADAYAEGIRSRLAALERCALDAEGLESPYVNELALSKEWITCKVWAWRRPTHINLLETASVYRLCKQLAYDSGPLRFCSLCDSNVARCAITKGRSPSHGLTKGLKRIAAVCLGFGLYPQLPFCPTRHMPADHPTRDAPFPLPRPPTRAQLLPFHLLPRVRRWLANWVRLVCLASQVRPLLRVGTRDANRFPGEGPKVCFGGGVFRASFCMPALLAFVGSSHGMRPRNAGDELRQVARAPVPLPQGRPVEAKTQKLRDHLWQQFLDWLHQEGVDDALFLETAGLIDVDSVNAVLARYGRELYRSGRPYSQFSETLNAFSARVPKIRRVLQPAWDVAYAWRRVEPGQHHTAMPWQVLIACVSAALLWGWPRVAAILAMTWGGLLRIGEALSAVRRDLLLPEDVAHTTDFVLLSIKEPKTRFSAARHQAVKIDQPDLVKLITLGFQHLRPEEKLWNMSSQTLRTRFKQICNALEIPCEPKKGRLHLELSSLRAGGATWLMLTSDDSKLVRRRGRWLTPKIMEIYVQEVSALQFLPTLDQNARSKVFQALVTFPQLVATASFFASSGLPTTTWYNLLAAGMHA